METALLIVISALFATASCLTFVGMALCDLRKIRLDAWLVRHPTARFRSRPLVSVVVRGVPSDDCIESLWGSDYQKIEVVLPDQESEGKLRLLLPDTDTILDRSAISYAVHMLNDSPSLAAVELLPILKPPQTPKGLLRLYHRIAAAPFVMVRAGLGVTAPSALWPIIVHPEQKTNWRIRLYAAGCWLVQVASLIILLYVCYLALFLTQPILLIACLCLLGAWLILAIIQYPYLSFTRRLLYMALSPVSLGYFILLCLRAPFMPFVRPLQKMVFRPVEERVIGVW